VVLAILVMFVTALLGVFIFRPKTPPAHPGAGESFVNSIGMKMVPIPRANSSWRARGRTEHRDNELPQHPVEIKKPFYLAPTKLTRANIRRSMNVNPVIFRRRAPARPSSTARRHQQISGRIGELGRRQEFCQKLTAREQKEDVSIGCRPRRNGNTPAGRRRRRRFLRGACLLPTRTSMAGARRGAPAGAARLATMPVAASNQRIRSIRHARQLWNGAKTAMWSTLTSFSRGADKYSGRSYAAAPGCTAAPIAAPLSAKRTNMILDKHVGSVVSGSVPCLPPFE